MNFGELLPSTCIETVPGDYIEMHASDLLRAIPLATSPFLRAKQHLDVWFVPYQDLWHNFNNFLTSRSQPVSSALHDFRYLPHVDFETLLKGIFGSDTLSSYDVVGQSYRKGASKLLSLLGYGRWSASPTFTNKEKAINLFRIFAYNYIWFNEYRATQYDDGSRAFDGTTIDPARLFNADNIVCATQSSAEYMDAQDIKGLISCFQMRYRTWKKDLVTGLLPSTQFGNVSSIPLDADGIYKIYNQTTETWNESKIIRADQNNTGDYGREVYANGGSGNVGDNNRFRLLKQGSQNDFSILDLRKSEAIQIWRENALRAGNRVKDNMIAHYGVESDFRDHRPLYLGSVDAPLNIGDIDATAQTGNSGNQVLGSIAGKGLSSLSEKVFKFNAKDFGVIMVMHSLLPEAEYTDQGLDRFNTMLEPEDFFIPEHQNIGLEVVDKDTIAFSTYGRTYEGAGYAPRYVQYKQKLDKCFGEFAKSNGIFGPWCSPRVDAENVFVGNANFVPLSVLYVNPSIFDRNFSVALNNSDQFLCDVFYSVDAVRPMSVTGMPFGD